MSFGMSTAFFTVLAHLIAIVRDPLTLPYHFLPWVWCNDWCKSHHNWFMNNHYPFTMNKMVNLPWEAHFWPFWPVWWPSWVTPWPLLTILFFETIVFCYWPPISVHTMSTSKYWWPPEMSFVMEIAYLTILVHFGAPHGPPQDPSMPFSSFGMLRWLIKIQ